MPNSVRQRPLIPRPGICARTMVTFLRNDRDHHAGCGTTSAMSRLTSFFCLVFALKTVSARTRFNWVQTSSCARRDHDAAVGWNRQPFRRKRDFIILLRRFTDRLPAVSG